MAGWYFKVSPEWMLARRDVLTATDIKGMVPEMKRLAKLRKDDPDALSSGFAALWCEKNSQTMVDVDSWGAAARGHAMEPYAVDDWNKQRNDKFRHWDDCIVCNGEVGFSPDATNIPQPLADVRMDVSGESLTDSSKGLFPAPTRIMEIKSYAPSHHMKSYLEDDMDRDELMQIAVAFYVLPMLEEAVLLFYCPGAPISMFYSVYSRDKLASQIEMVGKIVEEYKKTGEKLAKMKPQLNAFHTELEVWQDNQAAQSQASGMFSLR